jgi:hypothetical protein
MVLKGFWMTAFVLALLASACSGEPAVPASTSLADGLGLTPRDDIDSLDAAIDSGGDVHVVWRERSNAYADGTKRERMVYRHGSGTPLHWAPAIVIAQGAMGSQRPRIFAAGDGVHILSGPGLHHWWLAGGGAPPRDLGEVLGRDERAERYQVAATTDGFLVVFTTSGPDRHQTLHSLRWTAAGVQPQVAIAVLQDFRGATPQLVGAGDQWKALWANNGLAEFRDPADGRLAIGLRADISTADTADGGTHWSAATPALTVANETVALAAQSDGSRPLLFIASDRLRTSQRSATGWTPPAPIADYKSGFLGGSGGATAVAATRCNGQVAIAWVDARYRKSDRRVWNPLGGFPWGDDPDWDNDDLFVARQLPASPDSLAALAPLRMTVDGSMTNDIALVARGGTLLVFRSGRARVRKSAYDAGAVPEVTVSTLACN